MEERYFCSTCCAEFKNPAPDRYKVGNRWIHRADGRKLCPYCYSSEIVKMVECPTCEAGWKLPGNHVCSKCHLRNVSELQQFARRWSPATLEDMTDILEGNGLVMFT